MKTEFTIEAGDPFFAGHFPGKPVFPGVGQIARAAALAPGGVVGVEQLRFRSPLAPDDRVEIVLTPLEPAGPLSPGAEGDERPARFRFELRTGARSASSGVLLIGADSPKGEEVLPGDGSGFAGPPGALRPVGDFETLSLVPHRPPALLLESLDAAARAGARSLARIPADSPYRRAGAAPGFLALEIASQTAAALETYLRSTGGGPPDARPGFLVSAREVACVRDLPDSMLRVDLIEEGGSPPLALYRFRITRNGESPGDRGVVARGRIGTWIQEAPAQES